MGVGGGFLFNMFGELAKNDLQPNLEVPHEKVVVMVEAPNRVAHENNFLVLVV